MDEYTGIFGYSHLLGGSARGQAAYVRVPLGDVHLLKIPDTALYLSDMLRTSYHTVKITKVHKGA
jgi:threonine dehydrogenase-like Zn-dependent dehydrogenase